MIGRTVSHYEILEKLGEGGMGIVYKAKDLKLDRFVALKFLATRLLPSDSAHARFMQEAHAISALNHPNIATIYAIEELEEQPVLVLEYLPGGTLRSQVNRYQQAGSKLPVDTVISYALQMALGLGHAHRHGIVHRDVKTSNALLGAEGTVKITDFGLSKLRGGDHITQAGTAIGTAAYMSPEQARGEAADPRSDIFSFGIVLYELATSELPFQGENDFAIVNQIVNTVHRPPTQLRPDLAVEIEGVIAKALQKRPGDRYQSIEELLGDLRPLHREPYLSPTLHAANPTITMETTASRSGWRKTPRARWLTGIAALAAIAMLLMFLLPRLRQRSVPDARQLAVLPFTNVGGEAANQAFCDGLAEVLTSMLSQVEQFQGSLWVVPASEVRAANITSVHQARQVFGVNLVVSGSVQRSGDSVRVTANLVDANTVRQLGSRTIDTRPEDIIALQDGVVGQVSELLEVEIQPQMRQKLMAGGTKIPAAFDAYLRGRGYLQRFDKAANYEDAIPEFQRALQLDPGYAQAYAGLAEALLRKYELTRDAQWLEQARTATSSAIRINDRLAPAHVDLGVIDTITGRYDDAIPEFQRALDLDRTNADAYRELAKAYAAAGKLEQAEQTYKRAIQLRPSYWLGHKDLGVFYLRYGRYAAAEASLRKVLILTPDNYVGYRNLGALYHLMGRYDEAREVLRKSIEIEPTSIAYSNLGTIDFFQGRYDQAVSMYRKAIELGANDYLIWGNLADALRWAPQLAAQAPEMYRQAIRGAEKQVAMMPSDAALLSRIAVYWAKLGDRQKAWSELEQARSVAPADPQVQFRSAVVYELTGKREMALEALRSAIQGGYSLEEIRREPELAKLRQDARYTALSRKTR